MKQKVYIFIAVVLAACGTVAPDEENTVAQIDTIDSLGRDNSTVLTDCVEFADSTQQGFVTYFVVVADTGQSYPDLDRKMYALNKSLSIPIDTMGRLYNPEKHLIALPDDYEDEIYAGNYIPRRFLSNTLSLEYLPVYQKQAGEKTIALVCGIYAQANEADSVLNILQHIEQKAFTIKAELYIGCMH